MKKINIDSLFPLLMLVLLVLALSRQTFNNVPPLGKVFDPFIGAVQNENEAELYAPHHTVTKLGLTDSVSIFFDSRKVPHIYAKNIEDAYFSQGYIAAYLRLWQMDFMSYAAAGRLSEIFPQGYLGYDRNYRRIGLLEAAKASLKMIEANAEAGAVLTAYTKGVNAFIKQLEYSSMPFEYKMLDYKPELWTNLKSVLVMKYMGNLLSGYEEDYNMTNLMLALGENTFNKLFPDFSSHGTPVVSDTLAKANPALAFIKKPSYLNYSFLSSSSVIPANPYNPKLGSNSWAVSGKKTKSGFPIICCDPHLTLSLPSIWIEMQLSAPGMNVYGVSIPGTPAIIIGFNNDIAWGLTNGQDDVKDWYKLKITDDYRKYELNGKWIDLDYSVEEIKRRGQRPFYDTIYHTIHGPIVSTKSYTESYPQLVNFALRWELHKPSNEFLTFIKLNKARNYEDFKTAISNYSSPVQNFIFAGKDNNIAVHHQGHITVKWPGQGKFLLDGTDSTHLYKKYIPQDSLPHLLNPSCNYVVSANQHPTGNNYAYYYNGYFSENRANRISDLLSHEDGLDIKRMMQIQLDNTSTFSAHMLPVLLNYINSDVLNAGGKAMIKGLRDWKGTYDVNDTYARLYDTWWNLIREFTWDEFKAYSFSSLVPDDYILSDLIQNDPHNKYFDKQGTTAIENAPDIIQIAFDSALVRYNKLKTEGVETWGGRNRVFLMHPTRKAAFSKMGLSSGGFPEAINAMSGSWGPSWRMIVELGNRPHAYGIFAGGQSGNVGSRYYDNFVDDWNAGRYFPLTFYLSIDEAKSLSKNHWVLR